MYCVLTAVRRLGESGAGKSESAKQIIHYLATVAGVAPNADALLRERLTQALVLLEAFGSAQTARNCNASRVGKFVRVHFDAGGLLCGASIQTTLLEKSRVVRQNAGERSFHIFYQVKKSFVSR